MTSLPSPSAAFPVRGINVCESLSRHTPKQLSSLLNRLVEWRMNTLVVHPQYGWRRHSVAVRSFCQANDIRLVHYLYTVLAFAKQAPVELLAVNGEGRPHRRQVECETRLCASNPAALAHFREGARRYFGEQVQPGDEALLATPDGLDFCQCAKCRNMNAIAQWQPFLEIGVEEILRSGKPLTTHFIAYIGRFRPPEDMGVFQHIDAVMFDTHLRYRWSPLGTNHAMGPIEEMEGKRDPDAGKTPINRYLLDQLKRWRSVFSGQLYVFENLMIQSCFSLPQPNTQVLLEDQQIFRSLGLDGVIYEAFEPGVAAFTEQIATLAHALEKPDLPYTPNALERICRKSDGAGPIRTRTLVYLFSEAADLDSVLQENLKAPGQLELAKILRQYLQEPTYVLWKEICGVALQNTDVLDWIYITYRMATYLPESERPGQLTEEQARLFRTPKPWDYLESVEDPHEHMKQVLASFP